jgi:hypothetical protein
MVGHAAPAPSHRYGAHDGLPGLAPGAGAQTPSIAAPSALLQISHAPLQELTQHTPSTHDPVLHSEPVVHGLLPSTNTYAEPESTVAVSSRCAPASAVSPDSATDQPK